MKKLGLIVVPLLIGLGLWLGGCGDSPFDLPFTPGIPSGTIAVDVNPDTLEIHWLIFDPLDSLIAGAGDSLIANCIAGEYTIHYGEVGGWARPEPSSHCDTLQADGSVLFQGDYTESPDPGTGSTIEIRLDPHLDDAPWSLKYPEGFWLTSQGDTLLENMPQGYYFLFWGELGGYHPPHVNPRTLEITSDGQNFIVTGEYRELRKLRIDVEPDSLDAPWRLSGTADREIIAYGYGDSLLTDLSPGDYTLTFLPVDGWVTPDELEFSHYYGSGTISRYGRYEQVPRTGTIVVTPQPEGISARWRLTGPDGYDEEFTREQVLEDMLIGDYTITWLEAVLYETPDPETETLTLLESEIIVFSATYTYVPPPDWIGIYLDPEGTITDIPVPPGEIVTLYVLAHIPSFPGGITAVEFAVDEWIGNPGYPVGQALVEWVSPLVMGGVTQPFISIALPETLYPDGSGNALLGTITIFAHQEGWPPMDTEMRTKGWQVQPLVVDTSFVSHYVGGSTCVFNPTR